ncbi:HEAT repeat-containing protein 4-like [Octopus sinensis]|uniref:HEAT repeat-containing protein 4-like n=1 Tax=Octopus sinensis TaxID=2607531 RepID=A0A7E6FJS9_9MOLL|nr:HEAT repeat-containing protein 4-like [Octopus sinensis]
MFPKLVNESALKIPVKPSVDTEMKSLKHILNPHLRQTVLHPTNPFQVELLSGCPLEHHQSEIIARQSQSVFKKHLQVIYPISSKLWSEEMEENEWKDNEIVTVLQKQISTADNQIRRGFLRWVALPEVIEPMISRQRKNGSVEDTKRQHSDDCTKNVKEFPTSKILAFWDENWYIKGECSTKSYMEEIILLEMIDLHPSVRCSAIFKAASIGMRYLVSVPHGIGEDVKWVPHGSHVATCVKCLPDNILEALQRILADPNEDVKISAALSLFCLHQGNEQAADILRGALNSSSLLKRWVAAYCLGYFCLWNSDIINELIKQIFMMPKSEKMMHGIQLLITLSEETDLVQLLLAEYLSSNSCHERQMTCSILSKLRSQMKKDISGKLLDLFWLEWNADVKMLAAYCLGCNNQGKRFHDDLLNKLDCSDDSIRRKALWIIGQFSK